MSAAVRLTDQALVAVTLARVRAAREARVPTVLDVVLGLAEEPDGAAGRLLVQHASSVMVLLATRTVQPGLAPLDVAVRWAAEAACPRPADTTDLLGAAIEIGGSALRDTLATVNDPVSGLSRPADWHRSGELTRETFGMGAPGDRDETLTPVGARAVARTRAAAGGAVELVLMLADDPRDELGQWNLPATDDLLAVLERLRQDGIPTAEGDAWDRGLEPVLDAARHFGPARLPAADLLRAALLAGGTGPRALLDACSQAAAEP